MVENKSAGEILYELVEEAYRRGLLSEDTKFLDRIRRGEAIENTFILLLATYAKGLESLYSQLADFMNSFDIDAADTEMLDRIGRLLGLDRLEATQSIVPVIFERDTPAPDDIEIPVGVKLQSETEPPVIYSTIRATMIKKGESRAETYAQSEETGPASRIGAMQLTNLLDENLQGQVDRVYNLEASTGGNSAETDEEYRVRIKSWPYGVSKGTIHAYERVLSTVPGLRSYNIESKFAGPGSIKVVVDPPYDPVVDYVKDVIQEGAQMLDEYVLVVPVVEKQVIIKLEVTISSKSTTAVIDKDMLENAVANAVKTFIDGGIRGNGQYWMGLGIGKTLHPSRLSKFILEEVTEIEDATIRYPERSIKFAAEERAALSDVYITIVEE